MCNLFVTCFFLPWDYKYVADHYLQMQGLFYKSRVMGKREAYIVAFLVITCLFEPTVHCVDQKISFAGELTTSS